MRERRRIPSGKARAALAWGLCCFVAAQLGLEFASGRSLPELRDPEYGVRIERLRSRLRSATEPPFKVIMLGSSRTTLGFVGSRLESCLSSSMSRPALVYNFGLTGSGPILEELVLRRLLDNGIHPDLVLIEVMPPLLAGQFPHEVNRMPVTRLWLHELPLLARYGASFASLRADWWETRPLPCHAYRFSILGRLMPAFVPYQLRMDWLYSMTPSGDVVGLKRRSPECHERATQRALAEYVPYFMNFRIEGAAAKALRDLLALCREQAIQPVLVLMPEGSAFRKQYPAEVWSQIEHFVANLSEDFHVPIINAREWMTDQDFSDSHHLLEEGAARFSERLGPDGVLPLLRKNDSWAHAKLRFLLTDFSGTPPGSRR